jgi:hypothetical protein
LGHPNDETFHDLPCPRVAHPPDRASVVLLGDQVPVPGTGRRRLPTRSLRIRFSSRRYAITSCWPRTRESRKLLIWLCPVLGLQLHCTTTAPSSTLCLYCRLAGGWLRRRKSLSGRAWARPGHGPRMVGQERRFCASEVRPPPARSDGANRPVPDFYLGALLGRMNISSICHDPGAGNVAHHPRGKPRRSAEPPMPQLGWR